MNKRFKKISLILLPILLIALLFFLFPNPLSHTQTRITKRILPTISLGVWTEGFFDAKTRTLHPEKLVEFEKLTNKKFTFAHYYRGWEALGETNLIEEFTQLHEYNWKPILNVNPYYFAKCPYTNVPLYKAIAEGYCDTFLHEATQNLKRNTIPFYLLFAWEMNNKDVTWSIPYTKSTASEYVSAWRHIHTIFRQEQVNTVIWVFCPNIPEVSTYPYADLYPGDAYVDWVCLDGYNWGNTQSWSSWVSFSDVFSSSYHSLTAIAPQKPMLIGEVNTTEKGGSKPEWYREMFSVIPQSFPAIKAVVIFNEDRSKQEQVNWNVDNTPEALDAFITGVHLPEYK